MTTLSDATLLFGLGDDAGLPELLDVVGAAELGEDLVGVLAETG
jgi:hypothetical protein